MLFSKVLDRLRTNIQNTFLFFRFLLTGKSKKTGRPEVYFDVSDPRLERYLYWLLKIFDIAGWNVSLKFRPWLLLNLRNYSEWLYDVENLQFVIKPPENADLRISPEKTDGKTLELRTDFFATDKSKDALDLPFFMHPSVYHEGHFEGLADLRNKKRSVRVFIGGTLNHPDYENFGIETKFGLVNRNRIRELIVDRYAHSESFAFVSKRDEALKILNGESNVGLLMLGENVLTTSEWLELMAKSDFFIAAPGFMMPFSHNIIESMAIGTIPITQYGSLFSPPLIDRSTCIDFQSESELIEKIDWALAAHCNEVGALRQNVVGYYLENLDPVEIVEKIIACKGRNGPLYLIAGHLSVAQN